MTFDDLIKKSAELGYDVFDSDFCEGCCLKKHGDVIEFNEDGSIIDSSCGYVFCKKRTMDQLYQIMLAMED